MSKENSRVVAFGEIMLRISPLKPRSLISRSDEFLVEPGGAESNVAVALAQLGERSAFVTGLPEGVLGDKVLRYLKANSVATQDIVFGKGRMGLYWTEAGSGVRPSEVFYDREDSAFVNREFSDFSWNKILRDCGWFHVSGITPALSRSSAALIIKVLSGFKKGSNISVDLNYRSKLWKWCGSKSQIEKIMWQTCSRASLICGNESDLSDALGLNYDCGCSGFDYERAARECFRKLKGLRYLAVSLRKSYNADHNDWSAILFVKNRNSLKKFESRKFSLTRIVDRVGSGDAFNAGLIFGLRNYGVDYQKILDFAVSLSALKHTIRGDASQFSEAQVKAFLKNPGAKIVR
jgi:2-dehydro-3-deoxygluconokinase